MMKIAADFLLTTDGEIRSDLLLITDADGQILSVAPKHEHQDNDVQRFQGCLVPGLINTHCHLELSHMKGLVDTGTSLLPFLRQVVKYRDFAPEIIQEAIQKGDQEMAQGGIVAVGDISNKTDTVQTKYHSKIRYVNFIEMFDFLQPGMTAATIEQYRTVYDHFELKAGDKKSLVPHAPYTVSPALFGYINENNAEGTCISIHNQETPEENALFEDKKGEFLKFFQGFGMNMDDFQPIGKRSIHHTIQHLKPKFKTIMVHNTTCTADDIQSALTWNPNTYWATCPNANLYIENALPNYQVFLDQGAKITIGTDSLTSNWHLSIIEEMRTLRKYCSYLPLETILTWATKNGAEALGLDADLGSFEVGKKPGIKCIPVAQKNNKYELENSSIINIF